MTVIVLSGMGAGITIMPPITNWLITTYEWRTSLVVLGILSLVIMIPGAQFLRYDPSQIGQLPYGTNETSKESPAAAHKVKGLSLGEAARTRQFWLICGMYFVFLWGVVIVLIHIVIHAIGLGVSPANSANILALIGGLSIIGMNVMGMAGDRFGNRPAFTASFLLTAISFLWLLIARDTATLYLFAVVFGFAYGSIQVLFSPLVAELFGLRSHGVILASCAFSGTFGAALGPFLAGYIFDTTGRYNPVFMASAALAIVAMVLTLFLRPTPSEGESS
jgi:predicted MFS family arabinose efflux permease